MLQEIQDNLDYVKTIVSQFQTGTLCPDRALDYLFNAEMFVARTNGGMLYDNLCSAVNKARIMFLEAKCA